MSETSGSDNDKAIPESFIQAMEDVKNGNTVDLDIALNEVPPPLRSSGVHIYWDDELILHASFAKRPENQEEMIAMLKHIIEVMETPSVPCCDCQVLGQANCPVHNL